MACSPRAVKEPVLHANWASRIVNNSKHGSAKQNQVAVMAAVRLRRELTIPLASEAGWGTIGEGQLQGPELGAGPPASLTPTLLLHEAAAATQSRPRATVLSEA